jgi:hypothetical protein
VAEDFFHGFSGWLIFIFGLAVLLLEMWLLNGFRGLRLFGGLGAPANAAKNVKWKTVNRDEGLLMGESEAGKRKGKETGSTNRQFNGFTLKAFLHPPQFIVAVVLLAAALAAAQGIEFREKIPPAKSFASFPVQVGEWTGKREAMEEKFVKELDLSEYVIVDYMNGGHAVNFYTAYYETQRKGESIHSPETCLPGSGWEFKKAGVVTIPLSFPSESTVHGSEPAPEGFNPGVHGSTNPDLRILPAPNNPNAQNTPNRHLLSITVNRALLEKGAFKQLSYFWFPQRDRVLTNAWELKFYNFWDALTRQRTDGALVRLITPVYPNETLDDADGRLAAFTQAIVPVLNEFLPQ